MAYNENIPVSGLLLDAGEIQENFYQGPPNIRTDLTVHGDVTISGSGTDAQLYFEDSTKYIDFNASDEFDFSHDINTASDITARDIKAKRYLYVNSDYPGGNQDANIYFNGTTQTLHFDYTAGQFEFSENVRSNGNTVTIGDGFNNDIYLNFDITEFDFPGQRAPRGFRYNFATSSMEVSHDGSTWNIVGTASFSGNLSEVLSIGNTAYDKEAYIGDIYAQQEASGNSIHLNPSGDFTEPTIDFTISGGDDIHLVNADSGAFYIKSDTGGVPTRLFIGNFSENTHGKLICEDIDITPWGSPSGRLELSATSYIESPSINTLSIYGGTSVNITGNTTTTGYHYVTGNLRVNSDYVSGDEDAIIGFNATDETFKFDYGLTAFMASAPNFYMGTGGAEDVTLKFYDDSATTSRIWVSNATGKLWVEDASGTSELNTGASISGLQQDLDSVLTIGNVTTQDIRISNVFADDYLYVNASGLNTDGFVYFYDAGAADNEYLKFDDSDDRFELSNDLYVGGVLRVAGANAYMKQAGPDGDQFLYFYDGGSTINEWMKWDDGSDRFEFSNDVDINGASTSLSANVAGLMQCDSFRIDQTPTASGLVPTHYATVNFDGTNYLIPLQAA
jgi:hypothetical protein